MERYSQSMPELPPAVRAALERSASVERHDPSWFTLDRLEGRFSTTGTDTQRPPAEISPPTGQNKKSWSGREALKNPEREGEEK